MDDAVHIEVAGGTRVFEMVLRSSPVSAAGARTLDIDDAGIAERDTVVHAYRGHLADDQSADVRVVLSDGALIGTIRAGGEIWYLEPRRVYDAGAADDEVLIYAESDLDRSALPAGSCGLGDTVAFPALAGGGEDAASGGGAAAGNGERRRILELTVVADYAFLQRYGADSEAYMHAIIDRADVMYRRDLAVTLQIVRTVLYVAPQEPWFETTNPSSLLFFLCAARREDTDGLGAGDLTHLFTGGVLDGTVIGLAYRPGVCTSNRGCGLSMAYSSDLGDMARLAGHEIGHNLGANHDGVSPCQDTSYGYVMWPTTQYFQREEFSACSQTSIEAVVGTAQCMALSPCGDGHLDPDEACDDGNNAGGDCCSADCEAEEAGRGCPDEGNECTLDVCDGFGACSRLPITQPNYCEDTDICTAAGHCVDGECVLGDELIPMEKASLKATLGGAAADDTMKLRAAFYSGEYVSPPTVAGTSIRLLDAEGQTLHESFIEASVWQERFGPRPSYVYESAGSPPAQAGGMVAMKIDLLSHRYGSKFSRVQARYAAADLGVLAGRDVVGLEIIIGSPTEGRCGTAVAMECRGSGGSLVCR